MRRRKIGFGGRFLTLVMLVSVVFRFAYSQDLPPEVIAYPQTVLFNGKILTVDENFSTAEALAIRGERILAVGSNDRILRMAGPSTERIDLQGKTAIPGFIDTHAHYGDYDILNMLLEEKGIQWEGEIEWLGLLWRDVDMALRDIMRAVDAAFPGELVRVPISIADKSDVLSKITMAQLDAISPQNPVVIVRQVRVGPQAANTKAMELVKIPTGTPGLPQDGGIRFGGQAGRLLADHLMWAVPLERVIPWHKKTQERANSWGITMVTTRITPNEFNGIRELWLKGELTMRWRVGFPGSLDIPHTGNVSDIGDDWLRISGSGGNSSLGGLDRDNSSAGSGVCRSAGGGMSGGRSAGGGASILGQAHWSSRLEPGGRAATWNEACPSLLETFRYGWSQPNSHVLGDIHVREMLNVIEEAQRNPVVRSSNQRFTLDHMVEVDERDIARMKRLGVSPSSLLKDLFSQGVIGYSTFDTVFGREYVHQLVPLKKYLDAGIRPTIEADTGEATKGEPLWIIERAVCRCVDGSGQVIGRDQKVSREDALRMKTIWSAAYIGDEKKLGSLEPGKLADLVVLDGDYLTVPEDQISELKVVLTIVGGGTAYSLD